MFYALPIDEKIGEISIGATYAHAGKRRTEYTSRTLLSMPGVVILDENPNPVTRDLGIFPATHLVNASLEWKSVASSPVDLSLFVTNLLKKEYYVFQSGTLSSIGFAGGNVNEFRMFGTRVRLSF